MFSWPVRSEHIRELLNNYCRHFLPIRLRQQTMTRTLNLDQSGWRRDQLNRRVQFLDRTKSVFSPSSSRNGGLEPFSRLNGKQVSLNQRGIFQNRCSADLPS